MVSLIDVLAGRKHIRREQKEGIGLTTGDFMTATLRRANAEKGYFMTDSST